MSAPLSRFSTALVFQVVASVAVAQTTNGSIGHQIVATAADAIRLDGKLDDPVWRSASWTDGFVQRDPREGTPATQRTQVAVMYDDDALYVAARMYSTDASAIRAEVTRRDVESNSEQLIVSLDTYLDRRTAVSFGITAAAVRIDYYHSSDDRNQRDYSYDPVWEGTTSIDSAGWSAELRIPFSQLRFNSEADQVWGINVARRVPAMNEESFWVLVPKNATGWASHFGRLTGIRRRSTPQRVELLPYAAGSARVTSDRHRMNPFDDGRNLRGLAGADVRVRLRSNFTLDATINPDFGQVEADPAEVNLTVFETTFSEKRPFFTEGRQLLTGGGAQYFYSRRIGAPPRVSASGTFVDQPSNATILGAAKLTGRTRRGLAIGALAAVTGEEVANVFDSVAIERRSQVVQPRSSYFVGRAQQQFGRWGSTAGGVLTALRRDVPNDAPMRSAYPTLAITGGTDWNLRFRGGEYVASFDAGFSHVAGDSTAMLRLQRSSARYYQRPDANHVELDASRRSLSGYRARAAVSRNAGRHWLWGANASTVSPGFELNDVGQLSSADEINGSVNLTYRENTPGRFLRDYRMNVSVFRGWNFDGVMKSGEAPSLFAEATFLNFWTLDAHYHWAPRARSLTMTRGGPAMLTASNEHLNAELQSAPGQTFRWNVRLNGMRDELGRSQKDLELGFSYRPQERWQLRVDPSLTHIRGQRQYVMQTSGGPAETYGSRYIFGSVERRERAIELRANYSFTPDLSIEVFAQPFVSTGRYTDLGELQAPNQLALRVYGRDGSTITRNADGYEVIDDVQQFQIANPDFTVRSLRSNAVVRWEWRRGSTFYLVWQQDRSASETVARRDMNRALGDLFAVPGEHRLAVKASYWLPM